MFQGDVLDLHLKDWTDGDIVFMNSTCFDDDLMDDLAKLAGKLDCNCGNHSNVFSLLYAESSIAEECVLAFNI
jgi:hypothetical protein